MNLEFSYSRPGICSQSQWLSKKESACQCRRCKFNPWVRKIPWRWAWQFTPVFLPGESHGQRHLVGYSPWGCKELDTTERLSPHPQDNYFESQVPTFDTSDQNFHHLLMSRILLHHSLSFNTHDICCPLHKPEMQIQQQKAQKT